MATPKKNTTTKVEQNALPVSLKPSNANEFPMVYADNIWHIAAAGSAMANEMGNSGQFDQQTINEQLATLIASALADIVLFKKTDGTAGSIKKIVDDAIAAVVSDAPAAFDTLKELSDWIAGHTQDASAMNTAIQGKVDKVNGKGLSENDYTDTEKSKLAGIESGAEANVIDGVTINGTAAAVANKKVALTIPQEYVFICKNYGHSTSTTITAATHGCGNSPLVVCYMNNQVVEVGVAKNSSGDITVSWNTSTSVSAANPLTICIVGVNVTPVEEEQPIVVPDASDYPYLEFTKTDEGECSVRSVEECDTVLDIPAAVMLDNEELAVTSLEDYAFDSRSELVSVSIPNSVTSIGSNAFYGCSNLETLTIGSCVETIGDSAFQDCYSLTSVTIPNSVTSIGHAAFYGSGLTSLNIPDSVTSIGQDAFDSCSDLETITIGSGVESFGYNVFGYCDSLVTVNINCDIPESLFCYLTSITEVTIGNGVTSIGESAFAGCSNLATLTIGNGVETIGENAFQDCNSLTSVTIPNSVTNIGDYAFIGCTNLETLTIGNSVTSIGESAFQDCNSLTSVTIPNSVTNIGNYAFNGCYNLTSVNIPESVTTISDGAFSYVDSNCIINCEATSQPDGWDSNWTDCENVVWGGYTPN